MKRKHHTSLIQKGTEIMQKAVLLHAEQERERKEKEERPLCEEELELLKRYVPSLDMHRIEETQDIVYTWVEKEDMNDSYREINQKLLLRLLQTKKRERERHSSNYEGNRPFDLYPVQPGYRVGSSILGFGRQMHRLPSPSPAGFLQFMVRCLLKQNEDKESIRVKVALSDVEDRIMKVEETILDIERQEKRGGCSYREKSRMQSSLLRTTAALLLLRRLRSWLRTKEVLDDHA